MTFFLYWLFFSMCMVTPVTYVAVKDGCFKATDSWITRHGDILHVILTALAFPPLCLPALIYMTYFEKPAR